MHPSFVLLRKSILMFTRNRGAMIVTFLVPVVLIALFGFVFGLYGKGHQGPTGIRLAVVNQSPEPAAADLIEALKKEKTFRIIDAKENPDGTSRPLDESDVRAGIHDNQYNFALILPADLISVGKFGIHLRFLSNPRNDIETQTVNGILQKTIFSRVPQLLGQALQQRSRHYLGDERFETLNRAIAVAAATAYGEDEEQIYQRLVAGDIMRVLKTDGDKSAGAAAPSANPAPVLEQEPADIFSRIARIETEQIVGKQLTNPAASRLIGGYGVMFLLMAISSSAASLFEESRTGLFQRILSAPVRLSHILWGRFLFGVVLGTCQLTFLFITGKILFGIEVFSHSVPLLAMIICSASVCTAFGMLLAAVSSTPEMAQGLGTLIVLLMSAIGGAWFPITMMPEVIQQLSKLTIVYWSVEGFAAVLWAGKSLAGILPVLGILLAITAGVMAVATWFFKRSALFD